MERFDLLHKEIWMQMVHGVNEVESGEFFQNAKLFGLVVQGK